MQPDPAAKVPASDRGARVARLALLAVLLVPLVLLPGVVHPYVVPRAVWFRLAVEVAAGVLFVLLLDRRGGLEGRDLFLRGLAAFVLIQLVTALTGVAPLRSVFGDLERMWGVYTWLHVALYYLALRTFLGSDDWPRFLAISVGVGAVAAGYAIVASLSPADSVCVERGCRAIGTLGNAGPLAGYMIPVLGTALVAASRAEGGWARRLFLLAVPLALAAIALSGTRAGVLGVGCGALVGMALLPRTGWTRRLHGGVGGVAAVAVLGAVVVVGSGGGEIASRLAPLARDETTMSQRMLVWRTGLEAAGERPLLGWGPENQRIAEEAHLDRAIYSMPSAARAVWDRIHDAPLDALVWGGIPGLIAFTFLWFCFFRSVAVGLATGRLRRTEGAVLVGTGVAYLIYLLFWFEDLPSLLGMVFLAAYAAARVHEKPLLVFGERRARSGLRPLILVLGFLILASSAYLHAVRPLVVARLVGQARDEATPARRLDLLRRALEISRAGEDEVIAAATRGLSDAAGAQGGGPGGVRRERIATALATTLAATEEAISRDPLNPWLRALRGEQYLVAFEMSGRVSFADTSLANLEVARRLSPNRVDHVRSQAKVRLAMGDPEGALARLAAADRILPGSAETAMWRTAVLLQLDRPTEAWRSAVLAASDPVLRHSAFVSRLASALGDELGPPARASLLARYIRARDASALREAPEGPRLLRRLRESWRNDWLPLADLPVARLAAGDTTGARRAAEHLAAVVPSTAPLVRRFVADLGRGETARWLEAGTLAGEP